MAKKQNKSSNPKRPAGKVGSDPGAARQVGGKGDFGIPESDRRDREYVSEETKANDPGGMPEHSTNPGNRVTGVGGHAAGAGSSSGGDIDTDFIGVGTGGSSFSQSGGTDRTTGPDIVSSDEPVSQPFSKQASKQAQRDRKTRADEKAANEKSADEKSADEKTGAGERHRGDRPEIVKGSTVDRSGGDVSTTDPGQGPGAVTNPSVENDDDSFKGEINIDEAGGIDNSPSDRE